MGIAKSRTWLGRIALLGICAYFWLSVGTRGAWLVALAGGSWAAVMVALPRFWRVVRGGPTPPAPFPLGKGERSRKMADASSFRRHPFPFRDCAPARPWRESGARPGVRPSSPLIVSALLAVIFLLQIPVTRLVGLARQNSPLPGVRAAEVAQVAFVLAAAFALIYIAVVALWDAVRCVPPEKAAGKAWSARERWRAVLIYALPCLIVWGIFAYGEWPGVMTTDSYWQFEQIRGLSRLDDWHPVGHTLALYLITRVWQSPAAVMIFQVVVMSLAFGWCLSYFEEQGMPRKVLFPLACGFALLPFNGIMLVSLWKDILYAVVNFILVFLLGQIWISRGAWLARRGNAVLLGAVLALCYLFRHNGLVILLLVPPVLFLLYGERRKPVLAAAAVALVMVVGVRNGLAFGLLHANPNPAGVAYTVPAQHISAVVHSGGTVSAADQKILEQVMPLDNWKNDYSPYFADAIAKPWDDAKFLPRVEQIGRVRYDLVRILAGLSLKYPLTVMRSEMSLMSLLWELSSPAEYLPYHFSFSFYSTGHPTDPLYIQLNLKTPVKGILDGYLSALSTSPAALALFWKGGIYLFLALALAVILFFTRGKEALILFLPIFANYASLALSMPTEQFRYVYPSILPVVLIILFAFTRVKTSLGSLTVSRRCADFAVPASQSPG